ncbi:MAG: hypothetical protein ACK4K0_03160 [Flavobacteriales bacterium]
MIRKLIFKDQIYSQLIASTFGAFIGILMLLVSVQLYVDFKDIITQRSGTLDPDYLVIKKRISEMTTLGLTKDKFSDRELENIRKQEFIEKAAPFKSGGFQAYAIMTPPGGEKNTMSTLVFFESIPNDFLDIENLDWNWKEGVNELPIIMPNTFLDAYNFGIANTVDAPKISRNIISSLQLRVKISGNGYSEIYYARIVDFTDRVNSILVPEAFINYANEKFGGETTNSSRIIIAAKDARDPKLSRFLSENGYETNNEMLRGSILKSVLTTVLGFLLFIGVIIIMLAVLSFLQYAQIIIHRSTYEIQVLSMLGYKQKSISGRYRDFFIKIFVTLFIVALAASQGGKIIINNIVSDNLMIELNPYIHEMTLLAGLIFLSFFVFFIVLSINIQVKRKISGN